jgi:hypothetical protein
MEGAIHIGSEIWFEDILIAGRKVSQGYCRMTIKEVNRKIPENTRTVVYDIEKLYDPEDPEEVTRSHFDELSERAMKKQIKKHFHF